MNKEYITKCREIGTEGIVLLKNDRNVLPFTAEDTISVFGRSQLEYYKSGTGSGGSVNVEYTTNLIDGLKRYQNICMNEELIQVYSDWIKEHPFDKGGGEWAGEPWHQEEMQLSEEQVKKSRETSNKAIVIIGRTAGEDQDNSAQKGSYYLTDIELENLELITSYFEQVVVLLNVANIMDMRWMQKSYKNPICAVLYAWQGGVEGGNALADILVGSAVPSGKLPDTIAFNIEDYPSTENFGNDKQNLYQEDIYVGYKFFETFCRERVMYPFGFGLSYTSFEFLNRRIQYRKKADDIEIQIALDVKNSGKQYNGKEVVQVYVQAPQGKLGKPTLQLVRFQKTNELKPGETQQIFFSFLLSELASYDDGGKTGYKSSYILEKGSYYFYAGTSVRELYLLDNTMEEKGIGESVRKEKNGLILENDIVCKTLKEVLAPTVSYKRMKPGKKLQSGNYEILYEDTPLQTVSLEKKIKDNLPEELVKCGNEKIDLKDVLRKEKTIEEFVAQLSIEEMAILVRGEGMCNPKVTAGTASAFGGVSDRLESYGIPAVCCADGPSGIRMDNGTKAMQLPIGTMLAATWNPELVEKVYECLGQEMREHKVDVLLGPGVNIHRNPLNGRNFEYYSEDAYVTGCFAAAAIRGLRRKGIAGTIKHFACNNQEYSRNQVNSVVSERALREIYLKGFELAVREGGALAVMTGYNPLNGHWCASNYDLCTEVLRNEWKFEGIVMTDWWAKMNDPVVGGAADMKNTAAMIRAQNDLYMVVTNGGAEENSFEDNTEISWECGKLTKAELQRSAINICRFVLATPAIMHEKKSSTDVNKENIVFKPVRFIPQEKEAQIEIKRSGRYKFIVKLRSFLSELAQSSSNIMLDDKAIATIQSNGTGGNWKLIKMDDVYLESGMYTMRLQEQKAGLEIAWIDVTK